MRSSKKSIKKTVNGVTFVEGSDNVFRDLGFPEVEAVNLMVRSQLMMEIKDVIAKRKLTQKEAAKILKVGQPRVSDLYSGKIGRFTVDMLMKWLARLEKQVTVKVKDLQVA